MKRDGVALTGSGIVAVDVELRVGALEETITVTGESPVVDTQSLTTQRVLNAEVIDALPSARNYFGLARMVPGTLGGGNDVGGSLIQDVGQSLTVHGSRNVDQRITINGVNTMTLQAGGNIGGQTPDMGSAAEVTVDTSSLGADLPTGGVRVNFVPKDGGNTFSNSAIFSFTNESLQGDNFSDELRAARVWARPTRSCTPWTSTSRSADRSAVTRCGSGRRSGSTTWPTRRRSSSTRTRSTRTRGSTIPTPANRA